MIVTFTMFFADTALCQSMDELSNEFNEEYEAVKPPSASSSVRTDYVFRQTAIATKHTAKILELMYGQNQEIMAKYDELLQKVDEIIQQNNEIIKALSELGKKSESSNVTFSGQ